MLYGEKMEEILQKCNIDCDNLPDKLFSTKLNAICDAVGSGGGSGGSGSDSGGLKIGSITPAEDTQTLTIEHGFGSVAYNFFVIVAVSAVSASAKAVLFSAAKRINSSQSYSTTMWQYSMTTYSSRTTPQNMFGMLCPDISARNENQMILSTTADSYLSENYPNAVFKRGVTYQWVIGQV